MRRIVISSLLLIIGLKATPALACATCLCGDPTITTMGAEKPFAGRMRTSVEYLKRGEKIGLPGISEKEIDEQRVSYSFSYALNDQLTIAATLPLVSKQMHNFDLSSQQASGIGDTDLSARWFIGKDEKFSVKKLWGMQFGLRLPTSSEQKINGAPIDIDSQPGAGATVPTLGGWYGRYQMPWFFYTSAVIQHAVNDGYQGYRGGDVLLVTGLSQYALGYKLAVQLSLDGRMKKHDTYHGVTDPDSGGLLIMATPGVAWTPLEDLVVNMSYQQPAVENLYGHQQEKPTLRVGVTYDF